MSACRVGAAHVERWVLSSASLHAVAAQKMNRELWAHSPNKRGMAQPYRHHIERVINLASRHASEIRCPLPAASIVAAATVHDLGKLAAENQQVLSGEVKAGKLPVPHADAGTLWMMREKDELAAMMVYAHHRGLPSIPEERIKPLSDVAVGMFRDPRVAARMDRELAAYQQIHAEIGLSVSAQPTKVKECRGLAARMALSCLVDADHSDTSEHYGQPKAERKAAPLWKERLTVLNDYVQTISERNAASPRTANRTRLYQECSAAPLHLLATLPAPVGAGKTLASMAYCLRQAISCKMRHVFVVLPFTAIIDQNVGVLRAALTLPGENPEEVVAAVHHKAEYESYTARALASQWDSPIIVTTSVQFFEILASNRPGALRRLHELPWSMIYIDEVHSCLPTHLWRVTWKWIEELGHDWNCRWLLGSGSLPKLWSVPGLVDHDGSAVPTIISPELSRTLYQQEDQRITLKVSDTPLNLEQLAAFVLSKTGPRLVVLNTVNNAAVLANQLRQTGVDTLHLSTALTPYDRARITQMILDKLEREPDGDWALVATSCIEAGMDFSFRNGFREQASLSSLVQTGGRVNRNAAWNAAEIWSIRLADDKFTQNPAFLTSQQVLAAFLSAHAKWGELSDLSTDALLREFAMRPSIAATANTLVQLEKSMDYPAVAAGYEVITDQRSTVVIDQDIAARIRSRATVRWQDVQLHSIQLRDKLIAYLGLQQIGDVGIYDWEGRKYDPDLLGYTASLL
jgi:CRISPR-associated endonuclease/helicase Cas3